MDILIDSTSGQGVLSFMDGFSGYNQIKMLPKDAEKTAFRTPYGNFYYTVMPFGLKNAGATYQRAMTAVFHDMMGKEVEDYVDNLVVKSKTKESHQEVLRRVLEKCRLYGLKMNPKKCAFGVSSGKFLEFQVHLRGIDVDLEKTRTLNSLAPPRNLKELKSFIGRLSYIRRSIPSLAATMSVFTPLLKKGKPYEWSKECQEAYQQVQQIITKLPTMRAPIPGLLLKLHLAATNTAVGALLAQDDHGGEESPIYYVSRQLMGAETRYPRIELLCLALVYAVQCLRHYFLAHKLYLIVRFDPVRYLLTRPVFSGHLARDSNLVLSQLQGNFAVKESTFAPYRTAAERLVQSFKQVVLEHIPGVTNRYADALATLGSKLLFVEEQPNITVIKKDVPVIKAMAQEEQLEEDDSLLQKVKKTTRKQRRFDFSEQWFLFFPNLIKYKEKESRVVLSVKMVSQHQSKDSGSKKNGGKELGLVAPQEKSSKKMKFASSSAETEPTSQTTISDDSKSGRGMSTMPLVVKRKLQKLRPIVEYNKRGKGIGQAHSEMQSYIGVLARSRVPLVDMKWSQIPKDIKEQIWEAVDMAFVVGQGGKNSVLASAAKKWKDFKSTLTRHYILPYTNDREKLSQPPETYKFIEKAQWDAFVASRLSKDFETVHSQHAQIREKLEYNHRLSRKGYAGLEDQLEETMPGVEIDRSTLWKRARQDKQGNIPDPKVAEKAKLIDELQKQVSEGKVSVYGSNDVLTMALGPEHPGRVRGVGAGISPRQYFNLPKPQRMSFDDRLKDSLRVLLQEETKKMEAKAREEALRMEARTKQLVEAEREHFLSQLSQLISNFDPSMLKPRISQSPKNPMSDKASCFGGDVRSLHFEDDTAKNGKHQEDEEKEEEKKDEEKEEEKQDEKEKEDEEKHDDKVIEVGDYSNMEAPSSLKTLCRYVETTLVPEDKTLQFTIDKEVFGRERDTFLLPEDITQFAGMEEIGATVVAVYMSYLHDVLKQANMCSMVGFIDPATVSANSGTIADRSRLVAARLQKTDGE
ncbi:hypothetical protein L3X38_011432 [Prunus dulcis]|uniref:Transposable element protein n=1 Tax=Prunus dulcis TaxID=3755 RepID=A0AAD4WI36_PRUDU|nr:hypothetical protein L3X38_011432 [Prunus dulcis]